MMDPVVIPDRFQVHSVPEEMVMTKLSNARSGSDRDLRETPIINVIADSLHRNSNSLRPIKSALRQTQSEMQNSPNLSNENTFHRPQRTNQPRSPFLRLVSFFVGPEGTTPEGESPGGHGNVNGAVINGAAPRRSNFSRSFRNQRTLERLPRLQHYRNQLDVKTVSETVLIGRPSMSDLLSKTASLESNYVDEEKGEGETGEAVHLGQKFGWVKGVMIRCFLNILGVMLFLRLSWMTGQAGIGMATLIILLSTAVSILTCLSMCAICTNGEVKGGGVYFMISRSLGPEFGGSIGVIFAFANAVAVGMHTVGFAETVKDLIKEHGAVFLDNGTNSVRVIGIASVALLLLICLIGLEIEAALQVGLMFIITAALLNFGIGTILTPSLENQAKGLTGYSGQTFVENFVPQYHGESFISLFSIFFPSVTGIAAGANISGDLKDPQQAIPIGTLLAILLTDIIYVGVVWMTGSTCIRYASGDINEYLSGNYTHCAANATCKYGLMNYYQVMEMESGFGPLITAGIFSATLSSALACLVSAPKIFQAVCNDRLFPYIHTWAKPYGKNAEPKRLYVLSWLIGSLIILIGDLNMIAPIISNFYLAAYTLINYACFDAAVSKSPGFRPSFKYFNSWTAIAGALLCVVVMFIMNWYYAIITFIIVAFLYVYLSKRKPDVNWGSSTDANMFKNALRLIYRLQNVNEHVKTYRPQFLVLTGNPLHRPSFVDFVSSIARDSSLMICGHVISPKEAEAAKDSLTMVHQYRNAIVKWFKKRHVKSFYQAMVSNNIREGVQSLTQTAGIGKLRPNILMLGFKNNWQDVQLSETCGYFNVILDSLESNLGVGIFRLSHGLDYSDLVRRFRASNILGAEVDLDSFVLKSVASAVSLNTLATDISTRGSRGEPHENSRDSEDSVALDLAYGHARRKYAIRDSIGSIGSITLDIAASQPRQRSGTRESLASVTSTVASENNFDNYTTIQKLQNFGKQLPNKITAPMARLMAQAAAKKPTKNAHKIDLTELKTVATLSTLEPYESAAALEELQFAINQFQKKLDKPTIDVWWLYDDGGLTVLIPYLLSKLETSAFHNAKLRVFSLASSRGTMKEEEENIRTLLKKFRIKAADVIIIPDIGRKPKPESLNEFDRLISGYIVPNLTDDSQGYEEGMVTEAELQALKEKTYRQIRTRELLTEYSMDASLIVLTLPVPRKGVCSTALYMSWLDYLTRNLPPILLVRGNQQSVLTFYS